MTILSRLPRDPEAYAAPFGFLLVWAILVAFLYQGYIGVRQLAAPRGVVAVTSCVRTSDLHDHSGYPYSCTGDFTGSPGRPRLPGVRFDYRDPYAPDPGTREGMGDPSPG